METHSHYLHPNQTDLGAFLGSGSNGDSGSGVAGTANSCHHHISTKYLHAAPYIAIASCVASIFGCLLIILTYIIWKDLRTMARAILFFLAIADFITAVGYIFGSVVYLHYWVTQDGPRNGSETETYKWLCRFQSYVTTVGPVSSFLWTMHLAIYLFITIVLAKTELARKMFIFFHITAWGIPILACTPALGLGYLGPGTTRTSTSWCFVAFNSTCTSEDEYRKKMASLYGFELLCGKFWEIMVSIVALVLYFAIKVSLWRRVRHRACWYSHLAVVLTPVLCPLSVMTAAIIW